ncbi:MAG: glycerophosphodiester phosphodiesterase [Candidatus Hodarchaeota archaeon]
MNEDEHKPLIIGHRGAYNETIENSLEGFKRAIDLKADYIEFDVHQSSDGEIIVMHDANTIRMTGEEGLIKSMTIMDLNQLKLPNGENIPTLRKVIKAAKGKIKLLCDLKGEGIASNVVKILREMDMIDSTIIQSFHIKELIDVRNVETNIKLGLIVPITEEYLPEWNQRKNMIREVLNYKFDYLITRFKNVDEKFVNYSHKYNLKVFVYPINSKIITKRYINIGVDGLIVNKISQTKAILAQLKDSL